MHMPDILSSKLAAPVAGAEGHAAGKDVLHLGPASDTEFREIMARQVAQDSHPAANATAPVAGQRGGPASLGERVMQRATDLSSELRKDQQYISKTLEQATRSGDSMQLMKAMLALSDYQTRVQFVSKAAAKAVTSLDQLTKLQ
ncbi:EscI/YscI/HrpB family type III secretion system inner rod protein [Duganella vulcania]|nr:EscI/YscI/HrpB family type III secretion system inner rod protein [Duganella vulcania]